MAALQRYFRYQSTQNRTQSRTNSRRFGEAQKNISACTQILAGLRFDRNLINQLFREEIMQESVIYQDIIQRGEQIGEQRGKQKGEATLILRQLTRRFSETSAEVEQKIQTLSTDKLEDLGEALLDFSSQNDLTTWLENNS
ncbi:hypothetical protein NIES267_51310 [Calothrix parasitica NIES-267]|uniref:DUF4351 domain-containing protein n=1 Tax=Calothrix parasitica NIES-267 TaxID=1973488 RepID=A0A1Z4LWQ5_9CYAN|nr:hypothetical protein NIES267_51310 [Calothrix parasitica NIES-267]